MGTTGKALALSYAQLVINPIELRVPGPRVHVISGNENIIRTLDIYKILVAPGVSFINGHGFTLARPC